MILSRNILQSSRIENTAVTYLIVNTTGLTQTAGEIYPAFFRVVFIYLLNRQNITFLNLTLKSGAKIIHFPTVTIQTKIFRDYKRLFENPDFIIC
jgi:hypothetical protein